MKIENITFIAEESSKNMVLVFCGNCINPFQHIERSNTGQGTSYLSLTGYPDE